MEWDSERALAVFEALDGAFPGERLAPNQPTGEANPYRDFTAGRAEEGLRASGQRYQDLLAERLLRPLGMTRSGIGGAGGGPG